MRFRATVAAVTGALALAVPAAHAADGPRAGPSPRPGVPPRHVEVRCLRRGTRARPHLLHDGGQRREADRRRRLRQGLRAGRAPPPTRTWRRSSPAPAAPWRPRSRRRSTAPSAMPSRAPRPPPPSPRV